MPLWLDELFLRAADALYALPRHRATPQQLAAVRIVSHRGERDNRAIFENTCAAFDPLRGSGVFGLEFDVRWTADLVPVVFHDADFRRLFGAAQRLGDLTWNQVRAAYPQVPALQDLVRRYTAEFHLMAELKHEVYPDPPLQNRRLAEALSPALESGRCHVLSLVPQMFALLPAVPASRTFGIARLNADAISAEALAAGRGGFACHFAALRERHRRRHHGAGQRVGCGFPASRALLHREAARGVDLVFTNQALALERWRRQGLDPAPRRGTPAPRG
jgi:glycerophosphoryl diester phosphodiesterase